MRIAVVGILMGALIIGTALPAHSYNYAEYVDAGTLMQSLPGYNPDPNDDEAVVKAFQAMFIKKMFLDEAFKAQSFFGENESVGMASGYGFYQEMMLYQMAQEMAQDDVFGLEHYFEGRR